MTQSLVSASSRDLAPVEHWRIVLDAFLKTLDSEATQRAYRKSVEAAMLEFGAFESLTALQLTAYRDRLVRRMREGAAQPLSPASVARYLAALRSFLRFARITGQINITTEVINFTLKSPKATVIRPYQVPTEKELNRLLVAARGNIRDRMLFELADAAGLRSAEVCNLKVGDITVDDDGDFALHIRQGKGRKDRLVPLDPDTAALLKSYLTAQGWDLGKPKDAACYLFPSRNGKGRGKLSTARLRQLKEKYRKKARIGKQISMHSLRHKRALDWLRGGGDIKAVQDLLGHSSLATTQRYLEHIRFQELKRVVRKARGKE